MRCLSTTRRALSRAWRCWSARLRTRSAAAALLVLLTLGVGESLLCIAHCDLWLPMMLHSSGMAAQHHQHHPAMADGGSMAVAAGEDAHATPAVPADPTSHPARCMLYTQHESNTPFHVPPSPVHELLPLALLPLVIILFLVAHIIPHLKGPLGLLHPPPLRPPILSTR